VSDYVAYIGMWSLEPKYSFAGKLETGIVQNYPN